LPEDFSREAKIARAEDVMVLLGLKDVADIKVGGELVKGISGGEKRRLSLAVEMINNPSTLLVDEPTSGLDASIALNVMQALKDIAASGKTVIVTVHQPRSDIWQAIDNLLLLSGAGTMVYGGKREEAERYFKDIGYPVPPLMNPADHLLDVVSVDPRPANEETSRTRLAALTAEWDKQKDRTTAESRLSNYQSKIGSQRSTNMLIALPIVLRRMWKNLFRQQEVVSCWTAMRFRFPADGLLHSFTTESRNRPDWHSSSW
jgi:ABC-type multidrug transport system ATPase subunit